MGVLSLKTAAAAAEKDTMRAVRVNQNSEVVS